MISNYLVDRTQRHQRCQDASILMSLVERNLLPKNQQTKVGKLLHMMRWSRPDILKAVRELSKFMSGASEAHMVAMKRVMKYCADTQIADLN